MQGHSLTCTFCRKSEHQVRKLVAGPGVYICDECVGVAHRIISSDGLPPFPQVTRWRRFTTRIRARLGDARGRVWRQAADVGYPVRDGC